MQIEANVPDISELTGKQGTLFVAVGRAMPDFCCISGFRDGHIQNVRTANLATFLISYTDTHNIIWEGYHAASNR